MTNEEYINELRDLVRQAQTLFDAKNLHENDEFRKWRQKLTSLLIAAEEENYNVESDVISRDFDRLVAYGSQPTLKDRLSAFNRDLQDTINELETIIEHFEKFGKSQDMKKSEQAKTNDDNHITMKGIRIPIWLIALCVFVFLFVILEQLYISKTTVDIWGLKVGKNHNSTLPKGSIVSWYEKSGPTPEGWAICDGSNGTPDLRKKFIMGVGSLSDVGVEGGNNMLLGLNTGGHSLAVNEMPAHNHNIKRSISKAGDGLYPVGDYMGNTNPFDVGVVSTKGSGSPHSHQLPSIDNRPSYYSLVYIMKLE